MYGCSRLSCCIRVVAVPIEWWTFLDVVIRNNTAVLRLLGIEYQALLVRLDALFVLDIYLHVIKGTYGLDIQHDRFAGHCRHKDLRSDSRVVATTRSAISPSPFGSAWNAQTLQATRCEP